MNRKRVRDLHITRQMGSAIGKQETSPIEVLKVKEERIEMDKKFNAEKYGMVICPLCDGKGFLIKGSEEMSVSVRRVCIKT